MPQISKSQCFFEKAEAALISAIEIYNKPDFAYREETFAILALNAWELLLKAKLLAENSNAVRCLYVRERRRNRDGAWSARNYIKRNRSGNGYTVGLNKLISLLDTAATTRLAPAVRSNLEALIEIRDNAVHFINASPQLAKHALEIGTASVKNFLELSQRWFGRDFSCYNFYLMPIGFVETPTATAIALTPDESRLVSYLHTLVSRGDDDLSAGFHVALEVNLQFKRSNSDAALTVAVTGDSTAPQVTLVEENIRSTYPWDYGELTQHLRERYLDFAANKKYHDIRKRLKDDSRYSRSRYLDPANPNSSRKDFFSPNIMRGFDRYYTR